MPNNNLSVLYKHIIQVEIKKVGLKVRGHKHTIAPPPPPLVSYASGMYNMCVTVCVCGKILHDSLDIFSHFHI